MPFKKENIQFSININNHEIIGQNILKNMSLNQNSPLTNIPRSSISFFCFDSSKTKQIKS